MSRQSTRHLTSTTLSLRDIGRAMQVDAVVEGSTLRVDSRARVAARLVQIDPEDHLWVDAYEGELSDVLALLTEIARTFAAAIAGAMFAVSAVRSVPGRP
jgi:TolB-like protein